MQHSNPVANALQPFLWGSGGQKMSPEEVARKRQLAAALASNNSTPQNLGQGLNRIGEALLYNSLQSRTADAEKAGRASTADAFNTLMQSGQPETAAIINQLDQPWGSDAQRAVLGQMLGQNMAPPQPAPERNILKGADGFNYYTDTGERVLPNVQSPAGASVLTPEERSAIGISPDDTSVYQRKPDGSIVKVGGSGVNVTTNILPEDIPGPLLTSAIESSNRADSLDNQVREIQVFADMARNADTGALTPVTLPIKQLFRSVGLNLADDVPILEAMNAQQNQMALRLRNPESGFGLTGNTSDRDVKFLLDTVAGIGKTPAGNIAILTIMEAKQRRVAAIERLKSNYIFENGTLKGWNEALKNYVEGNPFFSADEEAFLTSLKDQYAPQAQGQPQQQQDTGLGVGQTVDLGDGVTITRNN